MSLSVDALSSALEFAETRRSADLIFMALLWNLFAAGPLSRLAFRTFFGRIGDRDEALAAA